MRTYLRILRRLDSFCNSTRRADHYTERRLRFEPALLKEERFRLAWSDAMALDLTTILQACVVLSLSCLDPVLTPPPYS